MAFLVPATRLLERVSAILPRRDGTEVEFFDSWESPVSAAYRSLPGADSWLPEDLLARLIADQRVHRKRVALLWRDGGLWALVPLRSTGSTWQPLIRGIAEPYADFLCTHLPGEVLAALRLNLTVWNSPVSPAGWRNLRWHTVDTSYELALDQPPERHWRKTDLWKSVVQTRRRTANLEVVRDDIASAHWVIDSWHAFWFTGDEQRLAAKWQDQHAFVDWALPLGTARTWALRDGDRWVSGIVAVVKDGVLTFQTVYRDREYNWYSPGTRLYAEAMEWAYSQGLRSADLGGGFAYKRWWAEPVGWRHTYGISPFPVHLLNWTTDRARIISGRGNR